VLYFLNDAKVEEEEVVEGLIFLGYQPKSRISFLAIKLKIIREE